MIQLTDRQKSILKHLKEGSPVSGNFLSKTIGVSNKTIGREIALLSDVVTQYGGAIASKAGQGFILSVYDPGAYGELLKALDTKSKNKQAESFSVQRCHYIIRRLLTSDYVRINDLAEELYTSRSTIANAMKPVRKILDFYNITVEHKSNYGLYLVANEHQRRVCLVDEYTYYTWEETIIPEPDYESLMIIPQKDYEAIEEVVFHILKNYHSIDIPYPGLVKTIRMIWLCARRNDIPLLNCYSKEDMYKHQKRTSYSAAKQIMRACGTCLDIEFSREACILLTIYLVAHRDFSSMEQMINKIDFYETLPFTDYLINQLSKRNNLKYLDSDANILENLTLHLLTMKVRLDYRIHVDFIHNQEIKVHTSSLELAVQTADILSRQWGRPIDENEICFLALVFAPAFWHYNAKKNKRNIIIVSSINRSHGITMANRFQRNFSDYVNKIEIMQFHEVPKSIESGFDIVFSDMPAYQLQNITDIPVISVRTYFNEADKLRIRYILSLAYDSFSKLEQYFRKESFILLKDVKSRKEALNKIGDILARQFQLEPSFKEDILKRDSLCSAEIGSSIGIMRPIEYHGGDSFFALFYFDKPVIWEHEYVQLLCVWQYNPHREEIAELFESGYIGRMLRNLFGNSEQAGRLLLSPDNETLQQMLRKISGGAMI